MQCIYGAKMRKVKQIDILHLFYHIWPILWAGMKFNHFFHRLKTGLGVFKSTLTGAWLKLLWTHGGGWGHLMTFYMFKFPLMRDPELQKG